MRRTTPALPTAPINAVFPILFHTASTLSAPTGHLPLEGKADDTRKTCDQETFGHRPR